MPNEKVGLDLADVQFIQDLVPVEDVDVEVVVEDGHDVDVQRLVLEVDASRLDLVVVELVAEVDRIVVEDLRKVDRVAVGEDVDVEGDAVVHVDAVELVAHLEAVEEVGEVVLVQPIFQVSVADVPGVEEEVDHDVVADHVDDRGDLVVNRVEEVKNFEVVSFVVDQVNLVVVVHA